MKKSRDSDGQSNMDFLVGMSVFLIGFMYIVTFIPSMFMPYESGAVDMSSLAYKTCSILVEDPGWYSYQFNSADKGSTGWESQLNFKGTPTELETSLNTVQRLGLAENKYVPNVLSLDKISAMQQLVTSGKYEQIQEKLGLRGSVKYDFNLLLDMTNTDSGEKSTPLNILTAEPGVYMEKMERNVQVDTGRQLVLEYPNSKNTNGYSEVATVMISTVPSSDTHDVIVRIPKTGYDWNLQWIRWGDDYTNYGQWLLDDYYLMTDKLDYTVKINGVEAPATETIHQNDMVEIVFKHTSIVDYGCNYLVIKHVPQTDPVSGLPVTLFPSMVVDYMNDPVYPRKSIYYPGILTLEVWTYEP